MCSKDKFCKEMSRNIFCPESRADNLDRDQYRYANTQGKLYAVCFIGMKLNYDTIASFWMTLRGMCRVVFLGIYRTYGIISIEQKFITHLKEKILNLLI